MGNSGFVVIARGNGFAEGGSKGARGEVTGDEDEGGNSVAGSGWSGVMRIGAGEPSLEFGKSLKVSDEPGGSALPWEFQPLPYDGIVFGDGPVLYPG